MGSIPGQGTKIPQATRYSQTLKKNALYLLEELYFSFMICISNLLKWLRCLQRIINHAFFPLAKRSFLSNNSSMVLHRQICFELSLWPTRLTTARLHPTCPKPSPTTSARSSGEVICVGPWAEHLQSSFHSCWPSHLSCAHFPIQHSMKLSISALISLSLLWIPEELGLHSTPQFNTS